MEPTNQTSQEDKEFDVIKAKIPFDESDKKPEVPKEEPKPTTPPEPKPKEEPKEPVVDPKDQKPDGEEEPKKPSRPEKYIPIKQYTSEKEQWKETLSKKEQEIADLRTIADSKPDSKKEDSLKKAYMEKYDVDEETAEAEIERVRFVNEHGKEKVEPKKPETPPTPSLTPEQQAKIEKAEQIEATQLFNQEFLDDAVPQLKTLFPNATPEQLEKAKGEMESLATTSKYLDKSLDYIAFKERESLAEIFASDRKGPESSRPPQKGKTTYTSADFDKGKTPFSELTLLSEEERNNIVKGFSVKTWDDYNHYINQQDDLVVHQ